MATVVPLVAASSTAQVEADLIAKLKAACADRVRMVESLPGEWDDDTLKRLLTKTPGIYVAFAGGQTSSPGQTLPQINGQWMVYVATGHAQGQEARRLGDAQLIGAYELWEVVAKALHGRVIAGIGTATFQRLENLFTGTIENRGVAVYGVAFEIPMTLDIDVSSLVSPFVTFDAKWDITSQTPDKHQSWLNGDTSTSAPDAEDVVTLPQP
jgi:phage gp37-like protein